ncbi:MAG: hypothetical protein MI724_09720, partial [Spirochaetales bacterium]|nr:hypothetical protein [Spirochaetales bacterium]
VEAAGGRQIARIHPERFRRFDDELIESLAGAGCVPTQRDGDLYLFRQRADVHIEPEQIVTAVRETLHVLSTRAEELLDYVVVLDYRDADDMSAAEERMRRALRFAREQNAAYLSEEAHTAVGPIVQSEAAGALYRIVSFEGEGGRRGEAYHSYVACEGVTVKLSDALELDERAVWLRGDDTTVLAASLVVADAAASKDRIVVQCRASMSVDVLLQKIVQELPNRKPKEGESVDDTVAQEWEKSLSSLRDRIAHAGGVYLSEGWRVGELSLLLGRWFRALRAAGRDAVIELRDFDLCDEETRGDVLAHLSDESGPLCRIVVTARTTADAPVPTPNGGTPWFEVRVTAEDGVAVGADRYAAAHRYWSREDAGVEHLRAQERKALYLLCRLDGAFDEELLEELFPLIGISRAERGRIFRELWHVGLLSVEDGMDVHPAVPAIVDTLLDHNRRETIDRALARFLVDRLASGEIHLTPAIWDLIQPDLDGERRHETWHRLIHNLAGGAAFGAFDRAVEVDGTDNRIWRTSEASARIRLYLRDSRGPAMCREDFERIVETVEAAGVPASVRIDLSLSMGEYLLADRDYEGSLACAKRATMLQQQTSIDESGASHLLMARILLAQRRMGDSGHYLTFAREESGGDPATDLIARSLEAIRLFLVGNLTRAATTFSELAEPLLRNGFSEWLMLAWFARGRVAFELGEYRIAAGKFALMEGWAAACGMDGPAQTGSAWRHRALMHADEDVATVRSALSDLPRTAEMLLFVAESYGREGQFGPAIELLEEAEYLESSTDRWPRLGVCWDNGFASMEDLVIADKPGHSELARIISAYRAWALAQTGRGDEAVPIFYGLTRGDDGVHIDPYTGWYNYLYSSVLPTERSADRDDRITVLGKSVKLVQERTSRIDDYRDKMRFLNDNAWNRRLMET